MRQSVRKAVSGLLGLCMAIAGGSACQAQDQPRAPLANSFGRYWGIGWSAGYHARTESRFGVHRYIPDHNVVPQPVRGAAASQHLGSPYSTMYPGNAPVGFYTGGMPMQPMYAPGMHGSTIVGSMPGDAGLGGNTSSGAQSMAPAPVAKPVEPPPSWLKQYIKPDGPASTPATNDSLLDETSPSDRRGVYYQAPGISILQ